MAATSPPYLKLGGHIAYRLSDIEAYEQQSVCTSGSPRAKSRNIQR
jgi:hypothetical protein